MNQQLTRLFTACISGIKQALNRKYREFNTALWIAVCVMILRSIGLFQTVELAALDQYFHLRPADPPEERITIIGIDEASLRQVGVWPIPDQVIADLLYKVTEHKPRVIGLDIYRDLPVQSGYPELVKAYNSISNLITVELLANNENARVLPPKLFNPKDRVGFDNILYDLDGKVRRNLLYWHIDNDLHESFALKVALFYLKSQNIYPQKSGNRLQYLQLNQAIFPRFKSNDGAYVGVDDRGYQVLSNFPKPICQDKSKEFCPYRYISLQDIFNNNFADSWIKNRIVLIGYTAPSVQDFVFIPYSSNLVGTAKPIPGVELQAYFVHNLIAAALDSKPVIKVWSDSLEWFWIFLWSYLGAVVAWRILQPKMSILSLLVCIIILILITYLAFLFGWWLPVIPPLITLSSSAMVMISRIAYMQEEFKRSTEFLHQVLNTIPDPVFVKNEQHHWIVLNEAYCQFLGYPNHNLIGKSDYDFFPQHEADVFRQQDELVFSTQKPQENEEEFTDAHGQTHLIATKRSLHKDAAGNFFLVGVIRDITQRKKLEEELKRTAADLFRSNYELKAQENQLRRIAYSDSLTRLANRQFFIESLYESLELSKQHNLLLGLLFIDLDGFKQVNDSLGHEMGDRLLVIIAQRLHNSLRASDTVARFGGDEFTVILRAIANVQIAAKVAEKLLVVITEPIILDSHTIEISASIGISIYPINSQNSDGLIKQADMAMYCAKRMGKNRYEFA